MSTDTIHITIGTASSCYALLTVQIKKTEDILQATQSTEDKLFWAQSLAALVSARDELAEQMWPLSHKKAVAA